MPLRMVAVVYKQGESALRVDLGGWGGWAGGAWEIEAA